MTNIHSAFTSALLSALLLLINIDTTYGGSATWNLNPTTGDWNTAANWTPNTIPNGFIDGIDATATFDISNGTSVSIAENTLVNGIVFEPNASVFTFSITTDTAFRVDGAGIINNSQALQRFELDYQGQIYFTNSATAGDLVSFTNHGGNGSSDPSEILFFNSSSAGTATFTNTGGVNGSIGGFVTFGDSSTAAEGVFINEGGAASGSFGGVTDFFDNATAGNATFIIDGGPATLSQGGAQMLFQGSSSADHGSFSINGGASAGQNGGDLEFSDTASAGNAKIVAQGGLGGGAGATIEFLGDSSGGAAGIEIFGNAQLDISFENTPGLTCGSIEGSGLVFLGANNISIGANNHSTLYSGVMKDGGFAGGVGGSLTKIGTATLALSGVNTYTGGTTVSEGTLLVNSRQGPSTGSGNVRVTGGILGGNGIIGGAVRVEAGGILSPGRNGPGTLRISNTLTFRSNAAYLCELQTAAGMTDAVMVKKVSIGPGALISIKDLDTTSLPPGTVFTIIVNASAKPIDGTFSNLADGSTFTAGSNTFKANYEGGTGNDLTLTVQ